MPKLTKKQIAANEARVAHAFRARCAGVAIPIMEMTRLMRVGLAAIAEGVDDAALGDRIAAFVETIRQN